MQRRTMDSPRESPRCDSRLARVQAIASWRKLVSPSERRREPFSFSLSFSWTILSRSRARPETSVAAIELARKCRIAPNEILLGRGEHWRTRGRDGGTAAVATLVLYRERIYRIQDKTDGMMMPQVSLKRAAEKRKHDD